MALGTLHIVMLSSLANDGGGRETWVRYFAPRCLEDHKRVIVHSARRERTAPQSWPESVEWRGPHIGGAATFIFATLTRLWLFARREDLVLYCGVPLETTLVGVPLAYLRPGVRQIAWARSSGVNEYVGAWKGKLSFKRRVILRLLARGERLTVGRFPLIFNGVDTRNHFVSKYGSLIAGGWVIPNAVDISPVRNDRPLLRAQGRTEPGFRVAYVGRLVATKGFADFQRLAESLRDDDRFSFEVWGPNSGDSDISPAVVYHGPVAKSEVNAVLAKADCVVFLNRNFGGEASGVSHGILETLATGTPILAWDNETHRMLLSEEVAWLVPEGDLSGLTTELLAMYHGPLSERASRGLEIAQGFSVAAHISAFRKVQGELV